MRKSTNKKTPKKKLNIEDAENLSTYEPEDLTTEDLCSFEVERDCFMDEDFDERDVISRVRLF